MTFLLGFLAYGALAFALGHMVGARKWRRVAEHMALAQTRLVQATGKVLPMRRVK